MTDDCVTHRDVDDRATTVSSLLRLNRPPMNPLSLALLGELRDAARELAADAAVKAVVVAGSEKAFAAGADIAEFGDRSRRARSAGAFRDAFDAVAAIPRPVIAAIRGYALGGGLELAMRVRPARRVARTRASGSPRSCSASFPARAARNGWPDSSARRAPRS